MKTNFTVGKTELRRVILPPHVLKENPLSFLFQFSMDVELSWLVVKAIQCLPSCPCCFLFSVCDNLFLTISYKNICDYICSLLRLYSKISFTSRYLTIFARILCNIKLYSPVLWVKMWNYLWGPLYNHYIVFGGGTQVWKQIILFW